MNHLGPGCKGCFVYLSQAKTGGSHIERRRKHLAMHNSVLRSQVPNEMMDTLQLCTISISIINSKYLLHKEIKSEHTKQREPRNKTFGEGGGAVALVLVSMWLSCVYRGEPDHLPPA